MSAAKHQVSTVLEPVKNFHFSPAEEQKLSSSDLTNMATDWVESFCQAAIALDSDWIFQLIEQIPLTETNLPQRLTKMLKDFEYDEMLDLAEKELETRKL